MPRAVLEWPGDEPKTWRYVLLKEQYSRNGNLYVKHDGKVYVYKNRGAGTRVLSQADGQWIEAGRIDVAGHIFLGSKDQMSRAEYAKTPEAMIAAEEVLKSLRTRRDSSFRGEGTEK